MCNVCNVYDSAVCVSACVQTMVRFSITATTRGGATLLTHNCLEPPHCPEIFTILRKLLKFNLFATRVACVLCLSQALSVNFKESPDISKNPLNPQEAQILLDQKANPCRIVKSVVSNYRCIGRIDLTFAKHYKDKRFTS